MERDPFEENKERMSLNAKPRSPDPPFQPLFWVEVVDFVRARLPTQQDERALERVLEDLLDDCVGGLRPWSRVFRCLQTFRGPTALAVTT